MSVANDPDFNPYAAPVSEIVEPTGVDTSQYVGYATFWRRFGAWFIDAFLMGILGGIVGAMIGALLVRPGDNTSALTAQILAQVLSMAISWAYFAGMESSASQATVGKQALGIKVTDLYGRRITFGRATGRFFGKIVSNITFGIGYLMIIWTEKKQALHDQMASTLVLRTR